jgi:hypothetical protein
MEFGAQLCLTAVENDIVAHSAYSVILHAPWLEPLIIPVLLAQQ